MDVITHASSNDESEELPRMDPGEMQMVREYLGLTTEALASMLDVRHDTLRKWEAGRDPIPHRVREEIEEIEHMTGAAVAELVDALNNARDPQVLVYRSDEEMHAARPESTHLPARWWRMVVARARQEVPGVEIISKRRERGGSDGHTDE